MIVFGRTKFLFRRIERKDLFFRWCSVFNWRKVEFLSSCSGRLERVVGTFYILDKNKMRKRMNVRRKPVLRSKPAKGS